MGNLGILEAALAPSTRIDLVRRFEEWHLYERREGVPHCKGLGSEGGGKLGIESSDDKAWRAFTAPRSDIDGRNMSTALHLCRHPLMELYRAAMQRQSNLLDGPQGENLAWARSTRVEGAVDQARVSTGQYHRDVPLDYGSWDPETLHGDTHGRRIQLGQSLNAEAAATLPQKE